MSFKYICYLKIIFIIPLNVFKKFLVKTNNKLLKTQEKGVAA